MDADNAQSLARFGFLTVLESPAHGLFGGYLVLSPQGRPLEFRCSTPVAVSRAQEILYGPTLRPYLLAEVVGQALLDGATLGVQAILVDLPEALPLSYLRGEPVFCVGGQELPSGLLPSMGRVREGCCASDESLKQMTSSSYQQLHSPSATQPSSPALPTEGEGAGSDFNNPIVDEPLGPSWLRRLRVAPGCEHFLAQAAELLAPLVAHVDLAEPFDRIRSALVEAQAASLDEHEEPADELGAAA